MRISRDESLRQMAQVIAQRSTCSRNAVGVVIAREGRPLVMGYNGAPKGLPHCDHTCDCWELNEVISIGKGVKAHKPSCRALKPCLISIHAEANAIAWAARIGVSIEGAELFTTLSPCRSCAQLIVASGITRVISLQQYRDPSGIDYLIEAGVIVE